MDFGKLENIIFVAAACAVALLFIIVSLVVISKGKRKRAAGDRVLLAFSSIVLILSALMVVCAVFTGLNGSFRIDSAANPAVLYFGDKTIALPVSEFFVLVSNGIARDIVIGVFVLAFLTIACDALLTRKGKKDKKDKSADKEKIEKKEKKEKKPKKEKPDKAKKQKPAKRPMTPEEAKRMAELERIRRLGDAAVKKASDATKAPTRDVVRSAQQNPVEEEPDWLKAADVHPSTDQKGFVGLSHIDDNADFDTFDDVEDEPHTEEPAEKAWYEEDDVPAPTFISRTHRDETPVDAPATEVDSAADAPQFDEPESSAGDEIVDADDAPVEENAVYAERETEVYADDNGIVDGDDDKTEEPDDEAWYAQGSEEIIDGDDNAADISDEYNEENAQQTEESADDIADSSDAWYAQSGDEYGSDEPAAEEGDAPDRDAYIPKIRTIERAQKPAAERAARPAARAETAQRPAPRKSASGGASKPKPSQTKAAAAKKSAPKKSGKTKSAEERDAKKLPVNRRYVILDKTSAVNIFSDYLKEREKSEKDKLTSSINTIIIK